MSVTFKGVDKTKGYNKINLSFVTNTLTVTGVSDILGVSKTFNSSIVVSGLAGWRYVVGSKRGVATVETIPVGEIVSNIFQYTPDPVYNSSNYGYYSSVNTNKRILGVLYFDSTNITKVISYGNDTNKNDDYWETNGVGVTGSAAGTRLQFLDTWDKTWGTNIVCVDNGGAVNYDDTEGFRITFLKSGNFKIQVIIAMEAGGVYLHKKASLYKTYIAYNPGSANAYIVSIEGKVDKDDYFTFVNAINSIGTELRSFTISFEEEN